MRLCRHPNKKHMNEELSQFYSGIKKKLEAREPIVVDATHFGFVRPQDCGLEADAHLAGPQVSIHRGPGGFWKFQRSGDSIKLTPVTDKDIEEFKQSYYL